METQNSEIIQPDQERVQIDESLIEQEPETLSHYWHLGLAYLGQGQEDAAQEVWLAGLTQGLLNGEPDALTELIELLVGEAQQLEQQRATQWAWQIRQHIQALAPEEINNILHLIELEICLNYFISEHLEEWQIIPLLETIKPEVQARLEQTQLLKIILALLQFPTAIVVDFLSVSLPYLIEIEQGINAVMEFANQMAYDQLMPTYAADIAQVCLQFSPNNVYILNELINYYQRNRQSQSLIDTAWQLYHSLESDHNYSTALQSYFLSRVLTVLLRGSSWLAIAPILERFQSVLNQLLDSPKIILENYLIDRFWGVGYPLFYLWDQPAQNRLFLNRIAQIFQENIQARTTFPLTQTTPIRAVQKVLKIGYIAHTLYQHSVGWLSRWLFHYHDQHNFQLYFYLLGQPEDDLTKTWVKPNAHGYYHFTRDPQAIAAQIQADNIDILVDLDSLTNNLTAQVLALKVAPIQVTWLGLDASGLPAIDYFIADKFVLPKNAQTDYREKLWLLPQTYIAVDGFEIGNPTLSREKLGLNPDTIIYLSVQNKLKCHPDILRQQLRIIQAVPNSIFLIKGGGDNDNIRQLIDVIALEVGLETQRIQFLPSDPDELTHRANLAIADVVLDTYPYNGATTTLETLWMEIPLVTKVGEQFAARNSYDFLMQVGIQEGIAWSDQEYIDWGIRLGQDVALRATIKSKLQIAKQHSPLWNAQQFTQAMEKAYQQMWQIYCESDLDLMPFKNP